MSIGFKMIADPNVTEFRSYPISSQAFTIGDLVDISRSTGNVVPSTSSSVTYGIRGVAMETVTTSATSLLIALVNSAQRWVADSANNASSTHNGQRMVLTDARTVNNTGTDSSSASAVVEQLGFTGATTDKRIIVRFLAASNVTA